MSNNEPTDILVLKVCSVSCSVSIGLKLFLFLTPSYFMEQVHHERETGLSLTTLIHKEYTDSDQNNITSKTNEKYETSPTGAENGRNSPDPTPPNSTEPSLSPPFIPDKKRNTEYITNIVAEKLKLEIKRYIEKFNSQANRSGLNPEELSQLKKQTYQTITGKARKRSLIFTQEENKKHRYILSTTEVKIVAATALSIALQSSDLLEKKGSNVSNIKSG